jgi:hypothetical protein
VLGGSGVGMGVGAVGPSLKLPCGVGSEETTPVQLSNV